MSSGRDTPFVNNYGVWEDEFKELGLAHTLEHTWPDAVCYFGEGREVTRPPPVRTHADLCWCHPPVKCVPSITSVHMHMSWFAREVVQG